MPRHLLKPGLLCAAFVCGCAHSPPRHGGVETGGERIANCGEATQVSASDPALTPAGTDRQANGKYSVANANRRSAGWRPTNSIVQSNHAALQQADAAAPPPVPPADPPASVPEAAAVQPVPFETPPSESPPSTTLASLEQLAINSNPTLAESQARVDAAHGRWVQVGLRPNPRVGVSAQEIGNEGAAGQYGAYASQQFVRGGKLDLNRSAAALEIARVEQELAAQRLRVLTDVRIGFNSVLVAQERVVVAQKLLSIAQEAVAKARDLIKVEEPKSVLGQAEIEAELAAMLVENSQTRRIAQWRRLTAAIGQPDLPLRELDAKLTTEAPQIAWESALARLRNESPELAAVTADAERTRWALDRARAQPIPDVTLQAGLFYDDSSKDPFAALQMSMPLPVYDRNQGGISEAQANVIAAERAMQRVELNLQERLATIFQQYEQSRLQANRYSEAILPKARKNLELSQLSYESGDASYLDVLTTQRTYFQAELAWLNAVEQLWLASVQIDGLLLTGSLRVGG